MKTNISEGEAQEEMSEAAIDRTLADSFPASDPPCWTLGVKKTKGRAAEGWGAERTRERQGVQETARV